MSVAFSKAGLPCRYLFRSTMLHAHIKQVYAPQWATLFGAVVALSLQMYCYDVLAPDVVVALSVHVFLCSRAVEIFCCELSHSVCHYGCVAEFV